MLSGPSFDYPTGKGIGGKKNPAANRNWPGERKNTLVPTRKPKKEKLPLEDELLARGKTYMKRTSIMSDRYNK